MIEIKNIEKSFGALKVLKGIDFKVEKGKIIAITGASGAGKSTLLHIMGTLSKPDKGEILFQGESVFEKNERDLAAFRNRQIGFVFQFHHLLPEFTAIENIMLPALIAGTAKNSAMDKAKELLNYFYLSERADHKPSELSGGEQQRVAVARALVNHPSVILADEPSGNLDSENAKMLHQLFFDLRDRFDHTFVIVTHNHDLAEMSDYALEMKDGLLLNN
ncbi:MAG: ABC transporter ATP-binding protein [Bacteroidales bacterium]|jgi:lipoprotein-releasing system ATP-binding protein|nr:ABC transporter ATP-binding protein [Bacteroidales bacterium]